ncbi:MAG: MFS transporter [Phenylobacterium sp.]|uniref:MFS transporter n=1 Tax=Phenylobacterium sp. TaxID=1871053 RepID=UPI0025DC11F5|nr:MFS transporter [Phenylobacterium sp.]MCG9916922.1 MFS transporter [Phenylobacterium sp.]
MSAVSDAAASQVAPLGPPRRVKFAYSLGGAGDALFSTAVGFIFFYYTAVLGLSGTMVGAALFIGLCADAAVDPFIGSWSDNLQSRFGRRAPLMFAGAPLTALGLGLLFSPPEGLPPTMLFIWLAVTSVAVRAFISLFWVPYLALGAEMADDYVERSRIVAWRVVVGILTSVLITALAYSVFFAGEGGLQSPERYPAFGWSVAALVLTAMTLCCLGIYKFAATLPRVPSVDASMISRLPGEVSEILRNRSFRILFFSAVIFYAAVGANGTLNTHSQLFVWKLRPEMMQFVGYAYLAGILVGIPVTPRLTQRLEKRTVVLVGLGLVLVSWVILPLVWVSGLYRPEGAASAVLLAANSAMAGIGVGFAMIAYPSMMADAADEHEFLFRRRREGLYFAGLGFAAKAASGVGVLVAGLALDALRFPREAGRAVGVELPADVLTRLLLAWGPGSALVALVAMVLFAPYAVGRLRQQEISTEIRRRRAADLASDEPVPSPGPT